MGGKVESYTLGDERNAVCSSSTSRTVTRTVPTISGLPTMFSRRPKWPTETRQPITAPPILTFPGKAGRCSHRLAGLGLPPRALYAEATCGWDLRILSFSSFDDDDDDDLTT